MMSVVMTASAVYELIRTHKGTTGLFDVQERLTQAELASVVDMIGEDPCTVNGNHRGKKALMAIVLKDMGREPVCECGNMNRLCHPEA
jgi:hypothetical protein